MSFSLKKYLQRNISLAIEFWCWHCIGTPSNRLRTMSFYSCSFPPEIKKKKKTKLHLVQCPKKIWRQHPLEILIKHMEKDCHSSCGKCYIWGFHANNVSKPKPHIWCQTALKIWSCTSFKTPFSICFFAFLYAGANSFGTMQYTTVLKFQLYLFDTLANAPNGTTFYLDIWREKDIPSNSNKNAIFTIGSSLQFLYNKYMR